MADVNTATVSDTAPDVQSVAPPSDNPAQAISGGLTNAPAAPVVPEKYTFELPEGLSMTPEIEGRFTEIAKGLNLTQEQASSLIKLHSDIMMDSVQQAENQKAAWAEECSKAGLSKPENIRLAKLAVDTFDDAGGLMEELIESGIAFSPKMQKFLQTIGGYLVEDNAPDGKQTANSQSAVDILFNNSKYQ